MNADLLNGDCISVLEYRSVALSVEGRERLPLSKQCTSHIMLFQTRSVSSLVSYLLQVWVRL